MKEDQLREGEGYVLFTLKNILLLLVGFVLGYIIKEQAVQNITMGYDDYKIVINEDAAIGIDEAQVEISEKDITTVNSNDTE
jgi:hypothetical protein